MSRRNRGGTVAVVFLFLATFGASEAAAAAPSPNGSALPRGASDITATAEGKRLTAEATKRYAAQGFKASALRAVKDDTGTLIVPARTKFATYSITLADGRAGTALAPLTPAASSGQTTSAAAPLAVAATPAWTFQNNACFSRISDTYSWMDHCYYMYRLSNDGNGTYDWFALDHWATMGPNSPWVLNWGKIRAYRSGSSAQTWADWSPRSDWSGGSCGTITVGVATPVGGIGATVERCPQSWDFTKSANGTSPDYTLQWFGPGTRNNRELEFEISVRVAQGGWAQWALPAEVHGFLY